MRPARRSGLSWQSSAAHRLYARAPASRCSGLWVATGLKPAPNGAPMVPVAASGPGNIDLGGDAVVVELLVARGGVPAAAQADLVEAVALLVLAEPLFLELVVADEVAVAAAAARRSSMSRWRSASSSSKSSRYRGSRKSRYAGEFGPAWQSAEMTT